MGFIIVVYMVVAPSDWATPSVTAQSRMNPVTKTSLLLSVTRRGNEMSKLGLSRLLKNDLARLTRSVYAHFRALGVVHLLSACPFGPSGA